MSNAFRPLRALPTLPPTAANSSAYEYTIGCAKDCATAHERLDALMAALPTLSSTLTYYWAIDDAAVTLEQALHNLEDRIAYDGRGRRDAAMLAYVSDLYKLMARCTNIQSAVANLSA
jgi:hypothetical protein